MPEPYMPDSMRFLSYAWITMQPVWQTMPAGADVVRPKPLGGRKRTVGEARPDAATRERARSKRRARA
jgi:hypothetical protein